MLLFLYTAVQLKPLTIVLQDIVAHTFFKMQHMATVHYENGHYHVHNELKSASYQEQNSATQKTPASEKTNENTSPQNITELQFTLYPSVTNLSFYQKPGPGLQKGFILSAFRPPSLA